MLPNNEAGQIPEELEEMLSSDTQMKKLLAAGFLTPQEYETRRNQMASDYMVRCLGKDISHAGRKIRTPRKDSPPEHRSRALSSPPIPIFTTAKTSMIHTHT